MLIKLFKCRILEIRKVDMSNFGVRIEVLSGVGFEWVIIGYFFWVFVGIIDWEV